MRYIGTIHVGILGQLLLGGTNHHGLEKLLKEGEALKRRRRRRRIL